MQLFFVTAAVCLIAGPTLAQSSTPQPPIADFDPQGVQRNQLEMHRSRSSYSNEAFRENLERRARNYNPVRENRAERVAALINSGQCQAAYDVTVRAKDRNMSSHVLEACGSLARPAAH